MTGGYPLDIDNDGIMDIVLLRVGENVVMRGLGNCQFERANEAWDFNGGDAWSTAMAATWEKDAAWPTIAIGNYIDRKEEMSPWGSCTDNWLHRPDASGTRLRRAAGAEAQLLRAVDAVHRLEQFRHARPCASPTTANIMKAGRSRCGAWSQARRRSSIPKPRAGSICASGAWALRATISMPMAIRNISSPAWPTTSCRRWPLFRQTASRSPPTRTSPIAKGVTAHRPYTGGDLRPSTGWHTQFEDVNNDGLVDLLIVKGNVAKMPDFAEKDPNNLLLQGADGKFTEAGDKAGIASFARRPGRRIGGLQSRRACSISWW